MISTTSEPSELHQKINKDTYAKNHSKIFSNAINKPKDTLLSSENSTATKLDKNKWFYSNSSETMISTTSKPSELHQKINKNTYVKNHSKIFSNTINKPKYTPLSSENSHATKLDKNKENPPMTNIINRKNYINDHRRSSKRIQ